MKSTKYQISTMLYEHALVCEQTYNLYTQTGNIISNKLWDALDRILLGDVGIKTCVRTLDLLWDQIYKASLNPQIARSSILKLKELGTIKSLQKV